MNYHKKIALNVSRGEQEKNTYQTVAWPQNELKEEEHFNKLFEWYSNFHGESCQCVTKEHTSTMRPLTSEYYMSMKMVGKQTNKNVYDDNWKPTTKK